MSPLCDTPCINVYVGHILKAWRQLIRSAVASDLNGMKDTEQNWERHQVAPGEAEDMFFRQPLIVRSDVRHSTLEKRYYALGQAGPGRGSFIAFTIRRGRIRVISAQGFE